LLTWTPGAGASGVHDVEFQVTNSLGETKKRTTRLVVEGGKLFLLENDHGEGGKSVRIVAPGAYTFEASSNFCAGVSFTIKESEDAPERCVEFGAPLDGILTEGHFEDTRRYPFQGLNHGLALWPLTADQTTGDFTVHKMAIDDEGNPLAFAASFEQRRDGSAGATRGYVEFNVQPDPLELPFAEPPVDFDALAGTYTGAILAPIPDKGASGLVNLSLNRQGRFTGRLRLGSRSIGIQGEFLPSGWASVKTDTLFVYLAILETGEIAVQVDDPLGFWGLGRMARRAVRSSVASHVGDYTMILGAPGLLPQVAYNGWGTAKVSRSGTVRALFKTAANTIPAVSAGGFLDSAHVWSFRSTPPVGASGAQSIVGDVHFADHEIADFAGKAFWFSSSRIGASVHDRRSMRMAVYGSRFVRDAATFPDGAPLQFSIIAPDAQPLAPSIYREPLQVQRSVSRIDCTALNGKVVLRIDLRNGYVRGFGDSMLDRLAFRGIIFQRGSFAAGLMGYRKDPFVIELTK
jgi:hypothetical protein